MKISLMDIGTLATYAIKYCMGRDSFVPDKIRSIVYPMLSELPDKSLRMMRKDTMWQRSTDSYGCQKGEWVKWETAVKEECERRGL